MLSGFVQGTSEALEQSALNLEPDVELLLASSNAIQRLIAERMALRERVTMLENELRSLRQQTSLVHDGYRKLTGEFVTQFKLLDRAVSNMFREPVESAPEQPSQHTPGSGRSSAAA